jgi:beta-lactam-binding protein with PASTA domain
VIFAALGVTFGVFFLAAARVASRAREVAVPDLRGRSIPDASAVLAQIGLVLRIDEVRRADAKVPENHILSQEPEVGTVLRRQRAVRVRVSDGQRAPLVPSVVGAPVRTAEMALADDQVAVTSRAEIRTADYAAGMVVAQDPPPKSRAAGVALLVNRRDDVEGYVMPDLIGTVADRTIAILRGQSFRVSSSEVVSPGLPAGVVVRQSPQAGFRITSFQTVTLEVSK